MKRITGLIIEILCVVLMFFTTEAIAQSFDQTFEWIDRFRQGENLELKARIQKDSFTIYRDQTTSIDKAAFESLARQITGLPTLKLTAKARIFVYDINATVSIEEQLSRQNPTQNTPTWAKRESIPIATFPIDQWGKFLKQALNHGLMEYKESKFRSSEFVTLSFKHIGPNQFESNKRVLTFSDEFYEFMKLSENFKPVAGSKGFVVLVHEPHSSVNGQFQLLPGLKALLNVNKANKFVFLVEGEYEAASRIIGFNLLDRAVDNASKGASAEPLVYNMLSRHLIDGPLAYRLLYDRRQPAVAIDDLELLEDTPFGKRPEFLSKEIKAIYKIFQIVEKLKLSDQKKQLERVLLVVRTISNRTADVRDIHGQLLVDYFSDLVKDLADLVTLSETLKLEDPSIQINSEIAFFKAQSEAYKNQIKIYDRALRRDITMTGHIERYAKNAVGPIPVAFIGSFHTDGITNRLREQQIGYVVIEPRFRPQFDEQERDSFDCILYQSSRKECLSKLAKLRKMRVLPSVFEVKNYYTPFLNKLSGIIVKRRSASLENFNQQPAKKINYGAFNDALKVNGVLTDAQISFGATKPPERFKSAFAFFEPGDGSKTSQLFIVDPNDAKWSEKGRFNCLREIKLIKPFQNNELVSLGNVTIYQERESKLPFASYFDPESRRFYLFEGEQAVEALIQFATRKREDNGDMLIRMNLSE